MIRIGITGNIGAGKSTVAKILQTFGAKYIDADKIGHKILSQEAVKRKLVKTFGKNILNKKGKIVRKKLAAVAFQSKEKEKKLNAITHPPIIKEICRRTKGKGIALIEATLLFESDLKNKVDYTIWVSAPRRLKIERAKKRYKDAQERLSWQMPEDEGKKLADFVIKNNGELKQLKEQCRKVWQTVKTLTN
ncbi:MAG: dephospho-CoA kinase [candidate division WOR-3 bacterium]